MSEQHLARMQDRALKDLTNSPPSQEQTDSRRIKDDLALGLCSTGQENTLEPTSQPDAIESEQQLLKFIQKIFQGHKRSRLKVKELEAENKRLRSSIETRTQERLPSLGSSVHPHAAASASQPTTQAGDGLSERILAKAHRDDLVKRKLRDKVLELRKANEDLQQEVAFLKQMSKEPSDRVFIAGSLAGKQSSADEKRTGGEIKQEEAGPSTWMTEDRDGTGLKQRTADKKQTERQAVMRDLVGSVKNRASRQQMTGQDCPCCVEYYAANPQPLGIQGPQWGLASTSALPSRPGCVRTQNVPQRPNERSATGQHQDKISRHRVWIPDPETPPDFWNMEMPDTQRVLEINREALAQSARRDARNRRYGL